VIAHWRDLLKARRQQHTHDLRVRAVEDLERARLHLVAALVDLRRVGAPVPEEVMASAVVLASYEFWLREWAKGSEA
jgi:hypothetical protein